MNRCLNVYCDGGARGNPGPAAAGFLIKISENKVLVEKGKYLGRATNNMAEYRAVILALEWLVKNQHQHRFSATNFRFFLDSQLIVNQLNGRFKIKNPRLKILALKVRELEGQIKGSIFYHYLPRQKNKEADQLVNQALDKEEEDKVR